MITFEEAVRIVDDHVTALPGELVHVGAAAGRFLAADCVARIDSPPFDNSAVDGFGRRAEDLDSTRLRLAGEIKAGDPGDLQIELGETVRIFTGAPVPRSVAAVSMQEDCCREGEFVVFDQPSKMGAHIRLAGDDFAAGQKVLSRGELLSPARVSTAISAGVEHLEVGRRPWVTILTTGSELVSADQPLSPGRIYNSNLLSLLHASSAMCGKQTFAHSDDEPRALSAELSAALESDVVITSGGVSVGEHDLVRTELANLGVEQQFWSVAIKPGKPVYFGTKADKLVFGLPGNPVSALVTFYLFVRPAMLKMMGHPAPWGSPYQARFESEARKKPGRMEFLRGKLGREGLTTTAHSLEGQGSHQMATMARADCLIHFPLESERLRPGDTVDVTPIEWGIG